MKISDWAFQWKIKFDPDPKKQPQKVIFSRKINKIDHPLLYFNENFTNIINSQTSQNDIRH